MERTEILEKISSLANECDKDKSTEALGMILHSVAGASYVGCEIALLLVMLPTIEELKTAMQDEMIKRMN